MQYRKDVQTLRGVAVLLVVLFHLDIACFASGFLGVDVFFVISGYLMALMYTPDAKVEFFTKRAKRLLPAYFATVLATVVASLFLTTPNDFSQVSTQAWFAAFFASNIGFWWENSYFDKAAFRPLLHLWSLGVEIQFYLFVPAIAWGAKRTGAAGLALVISISAVACFCVLGISPKTSFFWMPMRLWEFLLGFAVATSRASASGTRAPHLRWVGGACLLVVLLVPLFPVDGAAMGFVTGHPGLSAMVITVATAAILAVGLPEAIQSSGAGTALARVGDYSYSVYLAHFPVIVLTLYRPFAGTVLKPESMPQLLVAALLVLASSAALFRFVESHFVEHRCSQNGQRAYLLQRWYLVRLDHHCRRLLRRRRSAPSSRLGPIVPHIAAAR